MNDGIGANLTEDYESGFLHFEKVSPSHPDKIADRIAGALVDIAYLHNYHDPHIAVEVLIGHGECHIIAETANIPDISVKTVEEVVKRICNEPVTVDYKQYKQDVHLNENQTKSKENFRCGDNGIFKGEPNNIWYRSVADSVYHWYIRYPYDSKFIADYKSDTFIVCQSHYDEKLGIPTFTYLENDEEIQWTAGLTHVVINPIGNWTGGINVDTGATNRKLGSDLGDAVTGGGLHGKDLSKADVSINIMCHEFANTLLKPIYASCAIGDENVTFMDKNGEIYKVVPFSDVVTMAKSVVFDKFGGFERLAMWGLIAPDAFLAENKK